MVWKPSFCFRPAIPEWTTGENRPSFAIRLTGSAGRPILTFKNWIVRSPSSGNSRTHRPTIIASSARDFENSSRWRKTSPWWAKPSDGNQAEELAAKLQPDVILMDIKMPVKNGSAAAEAILKEQPDIGIVILTMYDEDEHLQRALKAGARSYLLKTANSRDVIAAVRAVHSGQSMIDTNMTAKLVDQVRRMNEGAHSDGPGLTEKETAVLKLLGTGFSNKQIARELNYSESTVKNRLSIIFEKIGVQDRTQAAIFAGSHRPAQARRRRLELLLQHGQADP